MINTTEETPTIEKPASEYPEALGETGSPETGEKLPETAGAEEMLTDEELNSVQPGKASPLDPDFILIFFFALIVDLAIDPFIETIGLPTVILPIINRILDVLTLFIIGGWIYLKSKQFVMPEKLAQRMKKMEAKVMAKIQAKISQKVASKAMRKALLRVVPALGIEMVPGLAIFTSWVVAVLSML